jgi:hypothetical protein
VRVVLPSKPAPALKPVMGRDSQPSRSAPAAGIPAAASLAALSAGPSGLPRPDRTTPRQYSLGRRWGVSCPPCDSRRSPAFAGRASSGVCQSGFGLSAAVPPSLRAPPGCHPVAAPLRSREPQRSGVSASLRSPSGILRQGGATAPLTAVPSSNGVEASGMYPPSQHLSLFRRSYWGLRWREGAAGCYRGGERRRGDS